MNVAQFTLVFWSKFMAYLNSTLQSLYDFTKLDVKSPKDSLLEEFFEIEANIKNTALNESRDEEIRKLIDERRYIGALLAQFNIDLEKEFPAEDEHIKLVTAELRFFIDHWCSKIIHFEYKSKFLNDREYCQMFFDYHLPKIWDWERDCFIFVNPTSTIILEEAGKRGIKNIIVVSKKKLALKKLKKTSDFKLVFHVKNNDELEKAILSQYGIIHRIQMINCGRGEVDKEKKKELTTVLSDTIRSKNFNVATYAKFSLVWAKNFISNFPEMIKNNILPDLTCDGYTNAIIVGAGPSLEKNINTLKKYQGKCLIVAVLHALPALHNHDIDPDFVVHIDCDPLPKFYKLTKPKNGKKIKNLILDSRVPEEYFKFPAENIYTYPFSPMYTLEISKLLGIKNKDYAAPNVSIFALRLCEQLGIKNVTLVGNDLSFGKETFYAKGCEWEDSINVYKLADILVDGYYGGQVRTSADFKMYISQFTLVGKQLRKRNKRYNLYNSTEGGANIEGWRNIPLKTFLEKYSNNNYKSIRAKNRSSNYYEEQKTNSSKFLKKTRRILKKVNKLFTELIGIEEIKEFMPKNDYYNRVAVFTQSLKKISNQNWLLSLAIHDLANEVAIHNRDDLKTIDNIDFYNKAKEATILLEETCNETIRIIAKTKVKK